MSKHDQALKAEFKTNKNLFKARLVRTIDGDTHEILVHLGLKTSVSVKVRLNDVDTPETFRPGTEAEKAHGEEATQFAEALLSEDKYFYARIDKKPTIYNRWDADLILKDGRNLSDLLNERGLVRKSTYSDN